MRRFLYVFVSIFFVTAGLSLPQNSHGQSVNAFVSADSLNAGDVFTFSIVLKKDRSYNRILFPDSSAFSGDIELRNRQRFRVADFKDSLSYQLQYWSTQADTIPALPIVLISNTDTSVVYTQPVALGFSSVLQGDDDELRPLKPIFQFARAYWPWLLGLLILLLIGAGVYYWYIYYYEQDDAKPAPAFTPQPFLNPLSELRNNLHQLHEIAPPAAGHFEAFYIQLGDAIRLYVKRLYAIPAMESTSREIINALNDRAIDERLTEQTRIVLRQADMVKFARFTPSDEQARQALANGDEFLSVAEQLHGQKIEQMQARHQQKIDAQRAAFEKQTANQTETE